MHHDKDFKVYVNKLLTIPQLSALYTLDFLFLLWETFSALHTFDLSPLVMQALQIGRTAEFLFLVPKILVGRSVNRTIKNVWQLGDIIHGDVWLE